MFLKDTNGDDKYDTQGDPAARLRLGRHAPRDQQLHVRSAAARSTCRKASSTARRSSRRGAPVTRQADGGVYRFEPRTWKFETYVPMNFPNPHGHVFDQWGRDIVFDATGGQPYYGPSFSTKKYYPAMETNEAPKPGDVRTRPVGGAEILSSRHFPEAMQGNLIVLNTIGFQRAAELQAERGRRGPEVDGSRADPAAQPTRTSGRWTPRSDRTARSTSSTGTTRSSGTCSTTCATRRATSDARPRLPRHLPGPPAAQAGADCRRSRFPQLLDLLKEPENRVRYRAKIELSARDTNEVMAALQAWIDRLDPKDPQYEHHMMEALWVHQWHNRVEREAARADAALERPVGPRRRHARALLLARPRRRTRWRCSRRRPPTSIPAVRLEAVRAASFFQTQEAAEVALASLAQPQDRFLEYTLDQTMNTLKPFVR